jgi:2-dehydropantoate 2-reductase
VYTAPDEIDFRPHDVVFLCVKSQDTESAMSNLRAVVKDVPIFCFQNGVRNEKTVSKYYHHVYGVMVKSVVFFTREGEVITRGNPPGQLVIGRYPEGEDELVESVAVKLRRAGYRVVITTDIMPYKWGKLIGNLTNAIGAITNTTGEEVDQIARATQNEGKEIIAMAGIKCVSAEELQPRSNSVDERPYDGLSGVPLGSTWQSLTRRQGTVETEFLNGEIVHVAMKLGKRAPINETLLHITEEMATNHESPGKYTPAELAKILKVY